MAQAHDPLQRRLFLAAVVFAVGSAIHVADHFRRGQGSITDALFAVGNLALVLQVVVITLAVVRHPRAPMSAAIVGPSLAAGFVAAHWLPGWSALSDPVWKVESWPVATGVASLAEILGAVVLGATGLAVVRRDSHLARSLGGVAATRDQS